MEEVTGDIWKVEGDWIVIPTNGFVKTNGECVMGRGLAYQAKSKFTQLPLELGSHIKMMGNKVGVFSQYRLLSFPVKHNWWEQADLSLIEESCSYLAWTACFLRASVVLVPRVGCGNGQLDWKDVRPVLNKYLGPSFVLVTHPGDE